MTNTDSSISASGRALALDVRVEGPDGADLAEADLRRLFPGDGLTSSRRERLRRWPRVLVTASGRAVAVATCRQVDREMRVPDFGVAGPAWQAAGLPASASEAVVECVLDATELMALAGGCFRIHVNPPAADVAIFERRGYTAAPEPCGGGWLHKAVG